MENTIENRVAQSGLITINPENFAPATGSYAVFDIKDYLYEGMILKERDFRAALKTLDWQLFEDKIVTITCSNEALIPQWAPMLVASYLSEIAQHVDFTTEKQMTKHLYLKAVEQLLEEDYVDARIVIKGCGAKVPEAVYVALIQKLQPVAKSIMYGEPCSTVPIFKRKKEK